MTLKGPGRLATARTYAKIGRALEPTLRPGRKRVQDAQQTTAINVLDRTRLRTPGGTPASPPSGDHVHNLVGSPRTPPTTESTNNFIGNNSPQSSIDKFWIPAMARPARWASPSSALAVDCALGSLALGGHEHHCAKHLHYHAIIDIPRSAIAGPIAVGPSVNVPRDGRLQEQLAPNAPEQVAHNTRLHSLPRVFQEWGQRLHYFTTHAGVSYVGCAKRGGNEMRYQIRSIEWPHPPRPDHA